VTEIRESHIRKLHELAISGIYPCGGRYRNATIHVEIRGSKHTPPHESLVPLRVRDLVAFVNEQRGKLSTLERAAYVLWRLNWIHPFAGGNGRTARALSYLIICIENGATVPGVPSMPTLIARQREKYVRCLCAADRAERKGKMDVSKMTSMLTRVLTEQLESAVAKLGAAQRD
jgi:Fic family protein